MDNKNNINWDQRRYEIAKEMLPSIVELQRDNVSTSNLIEKYRRMQKGLEPITGELEEELFASARLSIAFADALLQLLQK